MSSQCPVSTQMHTMETANVKLNNSAAVNRPQNPNDIRLPSEHGRIMYWHMGNSKKAKAIVAMIAVQTANSICIESKKKNITRSDMDAPSGRHRACIVSSVANLPEDTIYLNKRFVHIWVYFVLYVFILPAVEQKTVCSTYSALAEPVRRSAGCWCYHFVAFFLVPVALVPC